MKFRIVEDKPFFYVERKLTFLCFWMWRREHNDDLPGVSFPIKFYDIETAEDHIQSIKNNNDNNTRIVKYITITLGDGSDDGCPNCDEKVDKDDESCRACHYNLMK